MTSGGTPHQDGRIDVPTRYGGYPVLVGRGILAKLGAIVAEHAAADRLVIISDDNVRPLHAERLAEICRSAGFAVASFGFPAGEASKSRTSWSRLTDEMLDAGLDRDCCVLAVGGGVTTDLGGFVAATYLRGVPVLQVPTSYLAMIDASIGGKTGVNVAAGKNLVGAFHPPAAVVIDTLVLGTLPISERGGGLVEAVKHGALLDERHLSDIERALPSLLEADAEDASRCVLASVRLKAQVVSSDELEGGYRQILNFGHTIGHALEAASGYGLGHGRAVALGMLVEAAAGERIGVTRSGTMGRLDAVLRPLLEAGGGAEVELDPEGVGRYLGADKKSRRGRPRYVLLERIGRVAEIEGWTHELPDEVVSEALSQVLSREAGLSGRKVG